MSRIIGVEAEISGLPDKRPSSSRVLVGSDVAAVLRTVARHEGLSIGQLVEAMLTEWVPGHTTLRLVFEDTSANAPQDVEEKSDG